MFMEEEIQVVNGIKDFIKDKNPPGNVHVMLRNRHILHIRDYHDMIISNKVNPQDAYVYINIGWDSSKSIFYYPFLYWYDKLFYAYLSKLGFHSEVLVVPATGLKYVVIAAIDSYGKYLTIELVNLDTAVNNVNLPKIMFEVLGTKLVNREKELTEEERIKIDEMFRSQQIFAGHNVGKALDIVAGYYDKGNQLLAKEVTRIGVGLS